MRRAFLVIIVDGSEFGRALERRLSSVDDIVGRHGWIPGTPLWLGHMPGGIAKNFDAVVFWIIEIHRPGITVRDRHNIGDAVVLSKHLVHRLHSIEIVDSKGEMSDVVAATALFSCCGKAQLMMVGLDLA